MNKTRNIVIGLTAAVAAATALAVTPALAGSANSTAARASQATLATATLTSQQKAMLAELVEVEKLAHDLYVAFAAKYPVAIFGNIASSETQHVAAVRTLLSRYQVSDPSAGQPAGKFTNASVQALYNSLLAQGSASQAAALGAGVAVELKDIDDLERALQGLTAQDVITVYQNLLAASKQHLNAFQA